MPAEPKFTLGQTVRVADPSKFIASFARKIKDRDALVTGFERQFVLGNSTNKVFTGYVYLEFQKRNGRGQPFKEKMKQEYLILVRDQPTPEK